MRVVRISSEVVLVCVLCVGSSVMMWEGERAASKEFCEGAAAKISVAASAADPEKVPTPITEVNNHPGAQLGASRHFLTRFSACCVLAVFCISVGEQWVRRC